MEIKEIKTILEEYRLIDKEIKCNQEQLEKERITATSTSPSTGFGANGEISDKVGKAVARIVDLETEIANDIARLTEHKFLIRKTIALIPSRLIRIVMSELYLNCKTFEQVAEELDKSERWIKKLHGYGLAELKKMSLSSPEFPLVHCSSP